MKKYVLLLGLVLFVSGSSLYAQWGKNKKKAAGNNNKEIFVDSRDNKKYQVVEVGNQIWFAQNLDYAAEGSYYYKNNARHAAFFGRLYTWDAALNSCPDGWRLPSDEDWTQLEIELGLPEHHVDETDWRGADQGKKMMVKGTIGFNIVFGGYRSIEGNYGEVEETSVYWSSTSQSKLDAWGRGFELGNSKVARRTFGKTYGFSVRCIKN